MLDDLDEEIRKKRRETGINLNVLLAMNAKYNGSCYIKLYSDGSGYISSAECLFQFYSLSELIKHIYETEE
jgi:hypothetical protein